MTYLPPLAQPIRSIGGREFDFGHEIVVMGIVNRTPDSFHDKGLTFALDRAVEAAGGRPTTAPVDRRRRGAVLPGCAEGVAAGGAGPRAAGGGGPRQQGVVVSVDTVRPAVAPAAIAAGAGVINDTSGLRDPELADVVAGSAATLVITHSAAAPGVTCAGPRTTTW